MSEEKTPFLKETVKDEQVTGKKIVRGLAQITAKGLIFGLAACVSFCALKPLAETFFVKEDVNVSIPKDELEEDTKHPPGKTAAQSFTAENYREMNEVLYAIAEDARACVTEIRAVEEHTNWEEETADAYAVSGIIVWKKGASILILAPYGELRPKGSFQVKFSDDTECPADLKMVDKNLRFGIFSVEKSTLKATTLRQIQTAELGNSYQLEKGDSVIALGSQFGYSDGMGYGVISSTDNAVTLADHKYKIVMTDITAASEGSGVLFNMDGEVIGIVDQKYTNTTDAGLVSGYSISEIKSEIEMLSNGKGVPYLGIVGVEVTEAISEKEGIPAGLYVKEVEAESPAMEAGIQCGDVIVQMDAVKVTNLKTYSNALMDRLVGDPLTLLVKRQGTKGYEAISFDAVVGSKK